MDYDLVGDFFFVCKKKFLNPLMAIGNNSCQFNICCPRDCVSRHNGGTLVPPLNPSESIVLSEHYRL